MWKGIYWFLGVLLVTRSSDLFAAITESQGVVRFRTNSQVLKKFLVLTIVAFITIFLAINSIMSTQGILML